MVRALARDLAAVPGVMPVVARDAAIPLDPIAGLVEEIGDDDPWPAWEEIVRQCDGVWPIAPESDGILAGLSARARELGRFVLASREDALAITASKQATADHLARCGIRTCPTFPLDDPPKGAGKGWVVKPDDGVGAGDTHLIEDEAGLDFWREARGGAGFVLQPFLNGPALSLSLLAQEGVGWLLSCNRQYVEVVHGAFRFDGVTTSGAEERRADLAPLARRIAASLPGLWGYVGVDLIDTRSGPIVLEINPRLTTSYVGLKESLGLNVAGLVLSLREHELAALLRPLSPRPVEIRV